MVMDIDSDPVHGAKIKVIGIGGGGTNAVNSMIKSGVDGVDFVAVNTDIQSLNASLSQQKIQIGKELTKGLGAGANPDIGRDAALEDRHQIHESLVGADMVFITAGMGGGTGTGGASVISQIAKEHGSLTVGVVTKPFGFEGRRRRLLAEQGIERMREIVDTLIVIPNQRLLKIATPDLSLVNAFSMVDNVLVNAVRGISDIINITGTVNVDFADVKAIMSCTGQALMGIGSASGEGRASEAAKNAILSPLLEDIDIEGATGILINISASSTVSLMEANEACSTVQEAAHEDANIIFGTVIDESLDDELRVTVIATGFPNNQSVQEEPVNKKSFFKGSNTYGVQSPNNGMGKASTSALNRRATPERHIQTTINDREYNPSMQGPENRTQDSIKEPVPELSPEDLALLTLGGGQDSAERGSFEKGTDPEIGSRKELLKGDETPGTPPRFNTAEPPQTPSFPEQPVATNKPFQEDLTHEGDAPLSNPALKVKGESQETIHGATQFTEDINSKIDEALSLNTRIHDAAKEDDLDIPTFLRKKDFPESFE